MAEQSAAASDDSKPRCLTVLYSGDAKLRNRIIPIGSKLCIGRAAADGVDLAVEDRLLSRKHASLSRIGSSNVYELVDHDSRNGSFVDGVRMQRCHLTDGSILRLGVSVFELTSDGEDAPGVEQPTADDRDALVGRSVAFREVVVQLADAAQKPLPGIISGEAGTGKTMAAAYLHRESGSKGPLLVVGCGGSGPKLTALDLVGGIDPEADDNQLADGYLRSCEGGTLLLDEVDLLDPELQPFLLEILKTGKFKSVGRDDTHDLGVRILASTCANLEAAVEAGVFDRTLYEALANFSVELPSLRERRSDIPLLARHFLKLEEPGRSFDWSATFLEKLLLYDWPLNVRELRTVMRRLTMVEEEITTLRSAHLPKEIRSLIRMPSEDQLRASAIQIHVAPSREELVAALVRFRGDVQRVAEHYAKDRRHVYRWLTRHDLSASDYRGST